MANCYICGAENATQPIALKDSFTAHTRCKCPQSKNLCQRCYDCIEGSYKQCWYYHPTKEKWSKLWGRNWSWLICENDSLCRPHFAPSSQNDGLLEVKHLPTRKEIREWLINPPKPPFIICLAVSGQKHTYPFSVESSNRDLFPVLLEEDLIYCNRSEFTTLLDKFELLIKMGFSKTEIVSGNYHAQRLLKIDFSEFQLLENIISVYRPSQLLNLVEYVATKPEADLIA